MWISFAERPGIESCTLPSHSIWVSTDLLKGVKGNKGWSKLKTNWIIWQNITQPECPFDLEAIKQEFWLLTKCTYKKQAECLTGKSLRQREQVTCGESHLFSSAVSVTPPLTCAPYLVVSYSIPMGCLVGLSFQVINAELPNGMKIQIELRSLSTLCLNIRSQELLQL